MLVPLFGKRHCFKDCAPGPYMFDLFAPRKVQLCKVILPRLRGRIKGPYSRPAFLEPVSQERRAS